jgi:ESS family glutamate:Na+ symporter
MDVLIVAAIATMRVDALTSFLVPIALLIIGGAAWSAVCLLVLAPRLLPRAYWFELGLLNYGFSTANTPQGFMLLRIVDPELKSGAAEDYAVAAPLSAPFIGGGVVTFVLPWVLQRASDGGWIWGVVAALVALIAGAWGLGLTMTPALNETPPDAVPLTPSPLEGRRRG